MKLFTNILFVKSEFLNKVISATILLTLGTVISRLLMAGAYLILARLFSPAEYGEYSMISSTINNFLIFSSLGIGLTTTKFISEYKNKNRELASGILGSALLVVLILGIIIGSVVFLFSDLISVNLLKSPSLKPLLKYGAVILVLTAINSAQLGALLGLQSYKSITISNITQGVLVFIGLVIGGFIGSVEGAIIGNLSAIIILTIIIKFILKNENTKYNIRPTLHNWRSNLRLIYKFALPASLSSLIMSPAMWWLNTMLVRSPDGYSQLGIYSAVFLFPTAIQMINGSLNNALLPIFLSNETQISAKKEFLNYFGAWIITIILGVPFLVFPEIITFIIGSKYPTQEVVSILGFTMVSTIIIANRQGVGRDLIIQNRMWLSVFSMGQWSFTAIVIFYYLQPYGATGFAGAIALSYLLNLIIFIPFFIKLKVTPSYVFYNVWVITIWISLFLLVIANIYIYQLGIRIMSSLLLVLLIFYFIKRLYDFTTKKNI